MASSGRRVSTHEPVAIRHDVHERRAGADDGARRDGADVDDDPGLRRAQLAPLEHVLGGPPCAASAATSRRDSDSRSPISTRRCCSRVSMSASARAMSSSAPAARPALLVALALEQRDGAVDLEQLLPRRRALVDERRVHAPAPRLQLASWRSAARAWRGARVVLGARAGRSADAAPRPGRRAPAAGPSNSACCAATNARALRRRRRRAPWPDRAPARPATSASSRQMSKASAESVRLDLRELLLGLGGVELGNDLTRRDPVARLDQQPLEDAALEVLDGLALALGQQHALGHDRAVEPGEHRPAAEGSRQGRGCGDRHQERRAKARQRLVLARPGKSASAAHRPATPRTAAARSRRRRGPARAGRGRRGPWRGRRTAPRRPPSAPAGGRRGSGSTSAARRPRPRRRGRGRSRSRRSAPPRPRRRGWSWARRARSAWVRRRPRGPAPAAGAGRRRAARRRRPAGSRSPAASARSSRARRRCAPRR